MRPSTPATVLILAALASSSACGESTTSPEAYWPPPVAPGAASPPIVPGTTGITNGSLGYLRREIPVGGRLLIQPPIYVGHDEDWGPFAWNISDASVTSWTSLSQDAGLVEGRSPGTTQLTLTGPRMQAVVSIAVLDTTPAPNPVVVDEFYLVEVQESNQFVYAPRLVLRDTSGSNDSALIGLWFEIPDEGRTLRCAVVRPIGTTATPVLREYWGRFELPFAPRRSRLSGDQPVIAHLTLRVPGPNAREVTAASTRIVAASNPESRTEANADAPSCSS